MCKTEKDYMGPFSLQLKEYIDEKRRLGCKYTTEEEIALKFDEQRSLTRPVSIQRMNRSNHISLRMNRYNSFLNLQMKSIRTTKIRIFFTPSCSEFSTVQESVLEKLCP